MFAAYVTARAHVLFGFRLYLPRPWCQDGKQREQAHVPDETKFTTKPELGTAMLTSDPTIWWSVKVPVKGMGKGPQSVGPWRMADMVFDR